MAEADLGRTDPESKGVSPTTAHGPEGRELDNGLGLGLAEVIRPLAEVWRLLEVGLDDVVGRSWLMWLHPLLQPLGPSLGG